MWRMRHEPSDGRQIAGAVCNRFTIGLIMLMGEGKEFKRTERPSNAGRLNGVAVTHHLRSWNVPHSSDIGFLKGEACFAPRLPSSLISALTIFLKILSVPCLVTQNSPHVIKNI